MDAIGKTVEITSTFSFKFILTDKLAEKENLVFSYVELPLENNEKLIARILDVKKENLLLSIEQAGALAKELVSNIGQLSFPPERFEYAVAECEVVGLLDGDKIGQNRKPIPPAYNVCPVSPESIKALFYSQDPGYIPIGKVESFGSTSVNPVTINGDEIVSKHFAILGMTGSGKTNTAAKIVEELAIRNYKMIIFDPHDDYRNITDFNGIYEHLEKIYDITKDFLVNKFEEIGIKEEILIPLLNTVSIIYNQPIWHLFKVNENNELILSNELKSVIGEEKLKKISESSIFDFNTSLLESFESYNVFPEVKYYGRGFDDLSLRIMEGILGEEFSPAQRRFLMQNITRMDTKGLEFIEKLHDKANTINNLKSRSATRAKLYNLKFIYEDLTKSADAIEIDEIATEIFLKDKDSKNIHIFSLSSLSENVRKLLVYAIITFIFRAYKFGILNQNGEINKVEEKDRFPILFLLEEARTLIPAYTAFSSDVSGSLAVRAMKNLAYEGRKFKLAYGLISQKPSTIDAEISSQCNTLILHQLKSPDDQDYVRKVTEGLTRIEIDMLKNIGKGKAIVTGSAINSTTLIDICRRYSLEGIEEPKPLSESISKELENLKDSLGIYR